MTDTSSPDGEKITVSKLYPFPKRTPKNLDVLERVAWLWNHGHKFQILSGPPGVGKTLAAEEVIYDQIVNFTPSTAPEECRVSNLFPSFRTKVFSDAEIAETLSKRGIEFIWDLAVLHPQYSYEDLIRGYKILETSETPTLKVREGLLGFTARVSAILEATRKPSNQPTCILILDEINRAPIGQLFGEAIYALDRRGEAATTPYELEGSGPTIVIPKSLLLLGTMNSIDRATSGFDYALRRRFTTINVGVDRSAVDKVWSEFSDSRSVVATKLFDAVKDLVLSSEQIGTVSSDELVLGHAYFIPPREIQEISDALEFLAASYVYKIVPTLLDYNEQGLLAISDTDFAKLPIPELFLGDNKSYSLGPDELAQAIVDYFGASPANHPD